MNHKTNVKSKRKKIILHIKYNKKVGNAKYPVYFNNIHATAMRQIIYISHEGGVGY